MGQIWKGISKSLSVDLLYLTSYHLQTDGMSERLNQTVEIALRYYFANLPELNQWPSVLPCLSLALNNSMNFSSTGKTPTQVIYSFRAHEALNFLRAEDNSELINIPDINEHLDTNDSDRTEAHPIITCSRTQRCTPMTTRTRLSAYLENTQLPDRHQAPPILADMAEYRPTHIDIKDAIAFAAMKMKEYYDSNCKLMFFRLGDLVNLRLHRGYTVSAILHWKIQQQFIGPFRILECIGRLAYRLELPGTMKIHPIISIAHLEPATKPEEDLFKRPQPQLEHPLPVVVDGEQEFVVECLFQRRKIRRGRGFSTEYLVRWAGYGPEDNA